MTRNYPRTLSDLSNNELAKIEGFLELHNRFVDVYNAMDTKDEKAGIILADTHNPNDSATMATPRFMDDIRQIPLRIWDIRTVGEDDNRAIEKGSYPGALRINLTVPSDNLRVPPKSELRRAEIPPRY